MKISGKNSVGRGYQVEIVQFGPLEEIQVKYMMPETGSELYDLYGNTVKFRKSVICLVEMEGGSYKHLRFVRPARSDAGIPTVEHAPTNWRRLQEALRKSELPTFHQPGGFEPLIYADEIAVCDFALQGAHGWIVQKSQIGKLLDTVPIAPEKIQELREKKKFLEAQYAGIFSEQKVVDYAGKILWGQAKCTNRRDAVVQVAWTTEENQGKYYTYPQIKGPGSNWCYGDDTPEYYDIPDNIRGENQKSYRWLHVFDSREGWKDIAGFRSIVVTLFDADFVAAEILMVTREETIRQIRSSWEASRQGQELKQLLKTLGRLDKRREKR